MRWPWVPDQGQRVSPVGDERQTPDPRPSSPELQAMRDGGCEVAWDVGRSIAGGTAQMVFEFLIRRLGQAIIVVVGVFILVFVLIRMAPGDPVFLLYPDADPATYEAVRLELGLDQPIQTQFVRWVAKAITGDFGQSLYKNESVSSLLAERFPRTLSLVFFAVLVELAIALPLGIVSAIRRNGLVDRMTLGIVVLMKSMPDFWVAIMLLMIVSVKLKWLPAVGIGQSGFEYMILPFIVVGIHMTPTMMRTIRTVMITALDSDYALAAEARGLSPWSVVIRHAFRNCWIPVVTTLGVQVGYALSGAAIAEYIFNYQGLGFLVIEAVGSRDYPIIQAGAISIAVFFVMVTIAVDLSYRYIDPRIRKAIEGHG